MNVLDRFVVKKCKPNITKTKSDNRSMNSSVSHVSNTSDVSSAISKTVTNNSSVEHCVHVTFPSYWKKKQ
jgi:hypothetical protein